MARAVDSQLVTLTTLRRCLALSVIALYVIAYQKKRGHGFWFCVIFCAGGDYAAQNLLKICTLNLILKRLLVSGPVIAPGTLPLSQTGLSFGSLPRLMQWAMLSSLLAEGSGRLVFL